MLENFLKNPRNSVAARIILRDRARNTFVPNSNLFSRETIQMIPRKQSPSRNCYVLALFTLVGVCSNFSANADDLFFAPLFEAANTDANLVYRTDAERIDGSASTLRYDTYRPTQISGGPPVPTVLPGMILIHGGGFRGGSKNNPNIEQMAEYFARRGYVVSTINYRLLNESNALLDAAVEPGPLPIFPPTDPNEYVEWANDPLNFDLRQGSTANAAHNDASIFATMALQGSAWDSVDTSRIVIAGSSAGAITSMLTGYADHPNGPIGEFGAVISLAGGMYGIESVIDSNDPPLWMQHGVNDPTVPFEGALAIQKQADLVGLTYTFLTHNQGHSTTPAFFTQTTSEGLTFAEDCTRFLYSNMELDQLAGIVKPVSFRVVDGERRFGQVTALAASDNVDLVIRRAPDSLQPLITIHANATSPIENPSTFELSVESSVFARSVIEMTVALFNFSTNEFEEVSVENAARFVDRVTIVVAEGDLSRFVDSTTGGIRAQVRYRSLLPRQNYLATIDQLIWTIR